MEFKHPSYYKKLAKEKKAKKEKPITSDLFGIDPCPNCGGSGQVSVKGKEHEERTEDCDICNNEG
tara:strand:- start:63 stop:257 length:195 start_codon:yes stop_codon:yes gene_type:complete